jgi:hypothetical protein
MTSSFNKHLFFSRGLTRTFQVNVFLSSLTKIGVVWAWSGLNSKGLPTSSRGQPRPQAPTLVWRSKSKRPNYN